MKKIIFTGGGSGGHVTLNLGLIPIFIQNGWNVVYIGSENGIERGIIAKIPEVKYYPIKTGKLRRYFSFNNIVDAFKIPVGILQAFTIIFKEKPNIIFSKGGFVSFPVVIGGFLNFRKIYMHESDVTPGLANKMSLPFVTKFFTTFKATEQHLKNKDKVSYVGPVLSDRLKNGDTAKALGMCHFIDSKPIIMFVGGSLGAKSLNKAVKDNLDKLLEKYYIIHICGKGQMSRIKRRGYAQFEFVNKEFKDLLAISDIVVSRAGSNAIFEFWSLLKPMLLVPLPSKSSRGEQTLNAEAFRDLGFAELLADEDLDKSDKLLNLIEQIYNNKELYRQNMQNSDLKYSTNYSLYEDIVNG